MRVGNPRAALLVPVPPLLLRKSETGLFVLHCLNRRIPKVEEGPKVAQSILPAK